MFPKERIFHHSSLHTVKIKTCLDVTVASFGHQQKGQELWNVFGPKRNHAMSSPGKSAQLKTKQEVLLQTQSEMSAKLSFKKDHSHKSSSEFGKTSKKTVPHF